MIETRAFIVSAWDESSRDQAASADGRRAPRTFLTGRLEDGRSFAAALPAAPSAIFVDAEQGERAAAELARAFGQAMFPEAWTDFSGNAIARIELPQGALGRAERIIRAADIRIAALDRPRAQDLLSRLGIRGPVTLRGESRPGRRVDLVFNEPRLEACNSSRELGPRWMALDIETDRENRVVAVSLAGHGGQGEVLFWGPSLDSPTIRSFYDEGELLTALARRIVERDPDVVTGWNVIDFDFRVLVARFAALGRPFDIGRSEVPASFVELSGRRSMFDLPGRVALDGMRLVRASGRRFEDLSLEAVAREVLGEGKSVATRGTAKIEELERLRREEPESFCEYCLRDSELVLGILGATGLDSLTAKRAELTGVSLDLAWTSIPSFERVYAAELRLRRVLPPGKAERRVSGAAGGTVLDPATGIFSNVIVFDFRSLYPSIMRTFNIDPLAYERAHAPGSERSAAIGSRSEGPGQIAAPNGARFERSPGIMPTLIERYARERERAIAAKDETAAYVYKILMNSFYGVLGAEGCRYSRTELAGAITSFGKKYLTRARDFFEARGHRVLYGDTDSVFVLSGMGDEADGADLMRLGAAAADELNDVLAREISEEYGLDSYLKIRCEKTYRRFFIPRLRAVTRAGASGSVQVSATRGRAKGYAGLLLSEGGEERVEVKGMEAARSDFTALARRFQVDLLALVFAGASEDKLREFCKDVSLSLRRGELDDRLVYRRSLRRPAEEYATLTPPVRAARMLGWGSRRGRVSYVMTMAGAEPTALRSGAALDYEHYVERQLLPIALSVADALSSSMGVVYDAGSWFADRPQMEFAFR